VQRYGYVDAFYKVFLPRLLAMEPPKTEPDATLPLPDTDAQPLNKYVPLADR
jgi:hypothetical protein